MKKTILIAGLLVLSCSGDKKPTAPSSGSADTRTYTLTSYAIPCFEYAADSFCVAKGFSGSNAHTCFTSNHKFYLKTCTCINVK